MPGITSKFHRQKRQNIIQWKRNCSAFRAQAAWPWLNSLSFPCVASSCSFCFFLFICIVSILSLRDKLVLGGQLFRLSGKRVELVEPAQERIAPKDGSPGHLVQGIFTHVVGEQEVDQITH
jgi:hypothetical protein